VRIDVNDTVCYLGHPVCRIMSQTANPGVPDMSNTEDTTTTETGTETAADSTASPVALKQRTTPLVPRNFAPHKVKNLSAIIASLNPISGSSSKKASFKTGDSIKVHAKIVEGTKERMQVFEGVVIKCSGGARPDATFTVRKVSYNVGVERTFPLHSPRIDKIEVVSRAKIRRAKLFYLRPLRGKASRMKTLFQPAASKATSATDAG